MTFYLARFVEYRDKGIAAMMEIGQSLERHRAAMARTAEMTKVVVSSPAGGRLPAIKRIFRLQAEGLVQFSEEHRAAN
jgi:hypothetical protein